jgi:hypothetical protein
LTALDAKLLPKTLALVAKYGKQMSFAVPASGYTFDSSTGVGTPGAITTYVETCTPPDKYKDSFVNGDTIQEGDVWIILPAMNLAFTPMKTQQVTFDGNTWVIVQLDPLYSGDSVCAYELRLRK